MKSESTGDFERISIGLEANRTRFGGTGASLGVATIASGLGRGSESALSCSSKRFNVFSDSVAGDSIGDSAIDSESTSALESTVGSNSATSTASTIGSDTTTGTDSIAGSGSTAGAGNGSGGDGECSRAGAIALGVGGSDSPTEIVVPSFASRSSFSGSVPREEIEVEVEVSISGALGNDEVNAGKDGNGGSGS